MSASWNKWKTKPQNLLPRNSVSPSSWWVTTPSPPCRSSISTSSVGTSCRTAWSTRSTGTPSPRDTSSPHRPSSNRWRRPGVWGRCPSRRPGTCWLSPSSVTSVRIFPKTSPTSSVIWRNILTWEKMQCEVSETLSEFLLLKDNKTLICFWCEILKQFH